MHQGLMRIATEITSCLSQIATDTNLLVDPIFEREMMTD